MHDDPVVVAYVGGCDFEVVHGCDNVELELAVAGGLEDTRVDFDLFYAWSVELLESSYNSGFFAGARGAVDEEMREVAALCLILSVSQ